MSKLKRISLTGALLALTACSDAPETAVSSRSALAWAPQWGDAATAEFRPGSRISQGNSLCTAGFLFVDPVSQRHYLGTAGHCVANESSEDGMGMRVSLDTGTTVVVVGFAGSVREIGTVVFDSDSPTLQSTFGVDPGVDFALIELDPGIHLIAHPQVIDIEAPTGFVDCAETAVADLFSFHGHGLLFGDNSATRTRDGALALCDGNNYGGYTNAIFGDSGGPVAYADGRALGFISRAGLDVSPPTELAGPTLPYVLRELAKAGFANVALATIDGSYAGL